MHFPCVNVLNILNGLVIVVREVVMSFVIGVPACRKLLEPHYFHCVGEKYLNAVTQALGAMPVIIPAINNVSVEEYLSLVDGIVLTGSYSNVEPKHYGDEQPFDPSLVDQARDQLTLSLIKSAYDRGIPIFGICRGFQEINVALGGTLYQQVHKTPGFNDHREDKTLTLAEQYAFSHKISLQEGGVLSEIWHEPIVDVNSLHGQGVKDLSNLLRVEARAEDGLVEAFSAPGKPVLGVQWHPEWLVTETPFYRAIFSWFRSQCLEYRKTKLG